MVVFVKLVFSYLPADDKFVKKVLEADPYAPDSFARTGYQVKDGKLLGAEAGKTYLYISVEDEALGASFKKRLIDAKVESLKEVSGEEKDKAVSAIEGEGDSAASGFGSIFG